MGIWVLHSNTKKITKKFFVFICRQLLCSKIGFLRTSKLLNLNHLFKCYDSAPFSWERIYLGQYHWCCCFQGTEKKLARSWNLSIFLFEIKDIFSNYPKVAMYSVSLSSCIIFFMNGGCIWNTQWKMCNWNNSNCSFQTRFRILIYNM